MANESRKDSFLAKIVRGISNFVYALKKNGKLRLLTVIALLLVIVMIVLICVSCNSDTDDSVATESTSISYETTTEETTDETAAAATSSSGTGTYIVSLTDGDSSLNLRMYPSSSDDSTIIDTVPNGTEIEVLYVYGDWGWVEYGDTAGWLYMSHLTAAE